MNFTTTDIQRLVRAATRRTGFPIHDEDLVQDAALRSVEAFRRLRDIRNPRALLAKIVTDAVRDYWRKKRRPGPFADALGKTPFELPEFEAQLDRCRQRDLLRRALAQLDAGKRATVEMFYLEEQSIGEIAKHEARTSSAVKMELLRSRREISRIIAALSKKKSR